MSMMMAGLGWLRFWLFYYHKNLLIFLRVKHWQLEKLLASTKETFQRTLQIANILIKYTLKNNNIWGKGFLKLFNEEPEIFLILKNFSVKLSYGGVPQPWAKYDLFMNTYVHIYINDACIYNKLQIHFCGNCSFYAEVTKRVPNFLELNEESQFHQPIEINDTSLER